MACAAGLAGFVLTSRSCRMNYVMYARTTSPAPPPVLEAGHANQEYIPGLVRETNCVASRPYSWLGKCEESQARDTRRSALWDPQTSSQNPNDGRCLLVESTPKQSSLMSALARLGGGHSHDMFHSGKGTPLPPTRGLTRPSGHLLPRRSAILTSSSASAAPRDSVGALHVCGYMASSTSGRQLAIHLVLSHRWGCLCLTSHALPTLPSLVWFAV